MVWSKLAAVLLYVLAFQISFQGSLGYNAQTLNTMLGSKQKLIKQAHL